MAPPRAGIGARHGQGTPQSASMLKEESCGSCGGSVASPSPRSTAPSSGLYLRLSVSLFPLSPSASTTLRSCTALPLGEDWCTRAGGEVAGMWREVWHRWRDIGDGVVIHKGRARTSLLEIVRGRITQADREGNAAADKAAKEALAAAKAEAPADNYNSQLARAISWG